MQNCKIMIPAVTSTSQPQVVSPVDALWSLYLSQSSRVRAAFRKRLMEESNNTITPALAAKIKQARKDSEEGKTLAFSSAGDAQRWMDAL